VLAAVLQVCIKYLHKEAQEQLYIIKPRPKHGKSTASQHSPLTHSRVKPRQTPLRARVVMSLRVLVFVKGEDLGSREPRRYWAVASPRESFCRVEVISL